jgi:hypothetical protein
MLHRKARLVKKDIFIDTNIAKNFCNPLDDAYKRLIAWLLKYDQKKTANNAYLVISQKLLNEYSRTCGTSCSASNIFVIIDKLTREGRCVRISNQAIKNFKKKYFKKRIKLTCNKEDQDHIPTVLLSCRKYALSNDNNFLYDLKHFPGFVVIAEKHPDKIPYK